MGAERFKVVAVNPNDSTGGGGCLCSETTNVDSHGPYAVFEATDMENPLSPFPVLCVSCAEAIVKASKGEILAGGEVVNIPPEDVTVLPDDDDETPRI